MSNSTTNFFFDIFSGMILTLAVIAVFIGVITAVAFVLTYGIRAIIRWWRKRNE